MLTLTLTMGPPFYQLHVNIGIERVKDQGNQPQIVEKKVKEKIMNNTYLKNGI